MLGDQWRSAWWPPNGEVVGTPNVGFKCNCALAQGQAYNDARCSRSLVSSHDGALGQQPRTVTKITSNTTVTITTSPGPLKRLLTNDARCNRFLVNSQSWQCSRSVAVTPITTPRVSPLSPSPKHQTRSTPGLTLRKVFSCWRWCKLSRDHHYRYHYHKNLVQANRYKRLLVPCKRFSQSVNITRIGYSECERSTGHGPVHVPMLTRAPPLIISLTSRPSLITTQLTTPEGEFLVSASALVLFVLHTPLFVSSSAPINKVLFAVKMEVLTSGSTLYTILTAEMLQDFLVTDHIWLSLYCVLQVRFLVSK